MEHEEITKEPGQYEVFTRNEQDTQRPPGHSNSEKVYRAGILGEADLDLMSSGKCPRYGCSCISYERSCCVIV